MIASCAARARGDRTLRPQCAQIAAFDDVRFAQCGHTDIAVSSPTILSDALNAQRVVEVCNPNSQRPQ